MTRLGFPATRGAKTDGNGDRLSRLRAGREQFHQQALDRYLSTASDEARTTRFATVAHDTLTAALARVVEQIGYQYDYDQVTTCDIRALATRISQTLLPSTGTAAYQLIGRQHHQTRLPGTWADARIRVVIRDVTGSPSSLMATHTSTRSSSRPGSLPQLISIDDLAEVLGVTVRHVRRLVSERRIPFHKWGRLLRFDRAEVCAWLQRTLVEPTDDRWPS